MTMPPVLMAMPPTVPIRLTKVAPPMLPVAPMVGTVSVMFGAVTGPVTAMLPVSTKIRLPPLTAMVLRIAIVLAVPFKVAPPTMPPELIRVVATIEAPAACVTPPPGRASTSAPERPHPVRDG